MPIEITKLACESCGGSLNPLKGQKFCYCAFCGSSYYVDYGDTFNTTPQAPKMRPTEANERLSADYEKVKINTLSNFLDRVLLNYELIDEGYCDETTNFSRIYFIVRNNTLFIVEQISQLHVYEGKIKREDDRHILTTKYLCTYSTDANKSKKIDCSYIEKDYAISMNDCGRLLLKTQKSSFEVRLLSRYVSEYVNCVEVIEKKLIKLSKKI